MLPCQEATWAGHPLKTVQGCVLALLLTSSPRCPWPVQRHAPTSYSATAHVGPDIPHGDMVILDKAPSRFSTSPSPTGSGSEVLGARTLNT